MFSKAIVRTPCRKIVDGITTANLGSPIYEKAIEQHRDYVRALETCGLEVFVLEADNAYPDSTFVEDVALLTPRCAIITNPGAESRRGETAVMHQTLSQFYTSIEKIEPPGTVEAGDIMMVGSHFYIGLSERTNLDGIRQMIAILEKHGLTGATVEMNEMLHLKTGLAYLEHNNLVATGEFLAKPEFQSFNILEVDVDESYAANCVWINDFVLIPEGFPKSRKLVESAGYQTIAVDVSEFQKLDGGLSCLSLRF